MEACLCARLSQEGQPKERARPEPPHGCGGGGSLRANPRQQGRQTFSITAQILPLLPLTLRLKSIHPKQVRPPPAV